MQQFWCHRSRCLRCQACPGRSWRQPRSAPGRDTNHDGLVWWGFTSLPLIQPNLQGLRAGVRDGGRFKRELLLWMQRGSSSSRKKTNSGTGDHCRAPLHTSVVLTRHHQQRGWMCYECPPSNFTISSSNSTCPVLASACDMVNRSTALPSKSGSLST